MKTLKEIAEKALVKAAHYQPLTLDDLAWMMCRTAFNAHRGLWFTPRGDMGKAFRWRVATRYSKLFGIGGASKFAKRFKPQEAAAAAEYIGIANDELLREALRRGARNPRRNDYVFKFMTENYMPELQPIMLVYLSQIEEAIFVNDRIVIDMVKDYYSRHENCFHYVPIAIRYVVTTKARYFNPKGTGLSMSESLLKWLCKKALHELTLEVSNDSMRYSALRYCNREAVFYQLRPWLRTTVLATYETLSKEELISCVSFGYGYDEGTKALIVVCLGKLEKEIYEWVDTTKTSPQP